MSAVQPDYSWLNVLFLSGEQRATDGSRVYRCDYQARQLTQCGARASVSWLAEPNAATLAAADVLVLSRCRWNEHSVAVVKASRRAGKLVCGDFDDRIFCPWDAHTTGAQRSEQVSDGPRIAMDKIRLSQHGFVRLLPSFDETIVSTPALAEELAALGLAAHVSRNAIDSRIRTPIARARTSLRRLLFMTGTRTHDADFQLALPALRRFLAEHADVSLTLLGPLDAPDDLTSLPNVRRVERLPMNELYDFVAGFDACLVPLESTAFNECKSALKFIECGLVSVPVIASPRREFVHAITHRENGLLADDAQALHAVLSELYEHPALLTRIARGAHQSVLAEHTVASRGAALAAHFARLLDDNRSARPVPRAHRAQPGPR